MTPDPLPPEVWAEEGRRAAAALHDVAAAIVTGRDPDAAAAVALGIARAHAHERRVAVADLVGLIPALTPLDDQPGLLECLRDGEPISAIGQPLSDAPGVFVLPSGRGPIAERWVFESARWDKLVAGFREVDALLLLVTPSAAPGLARLIDRVDGVVAVDLPPTETRAWPLLATVDYPEQELPPIVVRTGVTPRGEVATGPQRSLGQRTDGRGNDGRGNGGRGNGGHGTDGHGTDGHGTDGHGTDGHGTWRRRLAWIGALALLGAGGGGAFAWLQRDSAAGDPSAANTEAIADASADGDSDAPSGAAQSPRPAPPPLEVRLGPVVNPDDSLRAARFAVELVAANTLASANSRLAQRGESFPAPTVAPVLLGSTARPWYRALVGAWGDRQEAERWLETQHARGVVRPNVGRVLAVPFALVLDEAVHDADLAAAVQQWEAQGVSAYALQQDDGRVRLYAGAFETASQAAWLAGILRELGHEPRVAYRTGRAF